MSDGYQLVMAALLSASEVFAEEAQAVAGTVAGGGPRVLPNIPSAVCPAEPGARAGTTARLYRAVIEIRDAVLALKSADTPGRATRALTRGPLEEAPSQTIRTAVNATVLIRQLDAGQRRTRYDRRSAPSSVIARPANLRLEAIRLAQASMTFCVSR